MGRFVAAVLIDIIHDDPHENTDMFINKVGNRLLVFGNLEVELVGLP